MSGTLALSWGSWGGCYVYRGYCKRLCLGWLALTLIPVEVDDLMESFAAPEPSGTAPSAAPSGDLSQAPSSVSMSTEEKKADG